MFVDRSCMQEKAYSLFQICTRTFALKAVTSTLLSREPSRLKVRFCGKFLRANQSFLSDVISCIQNLIKNRSEILLNQMSQLWCLTLTISIPNLFDSGPQKLSTETQSKNLKTSPKCFRPDLSHCMHFLAKIRRNIEGYWTGSQGPESALKKHQIHKTLTIRTCRGHYQ